jgi:hypothetical protein
MAQGFRWMPCSYIYNNDHLQTDLLSTSSDMDQVIVKKHFKDFFLPFNFKPHLNPPNGVF